MHQDDISIFHIFFHPAYDPVRVLKFPVQRVHIPQHRGQVDPAFQLLIPVTVWRAQILRPFPGDRLDEFFRLLDVRAGLFRLLFCHLDMAVAMISDQMALCLHTLYQRLFPRNIFSHEKEGCFYLTLLQAV